MNTELTHHGILGMKWGIRRFQNKDGSLTAAGRKRLDKLTNSGKRKVLFSGNGRHTQDSADEYTIKKGTKATRVYWYGYDGGKGYTTESEADKTEDNRKEKFISVEGMRNAGVNGAAFYYSFLADSGQTKVDTFEFKKDLKVAGGKQVMDYMYNKYGDVKVSDLIGDFKYNKIDPKGLHKDSLVKNLRDDYSFNDSGDKFAESRSKVSEAVDRAIRMKSVDVENTPELNRYFESKGYRAFEDINDPDTDFPIRLTNAVKDLKRTHRETGEEYIRRFYGQE